MYLASDFNVIYVISKLNLCFMIPVIIQISTQIILFVCFTNAVVLQYHVFVLPIQHVAHPEDIICSLYNLI